MENKRTLKKMGGKKKNFGYIVLSLLFIVAMIFTVQVFSQPLEVEEKVQENKISQRTSFDYKASVQPCTLFPKGGIVEPGEAIFTNVTDSIIITINSLVEADKSVKIEGKQKVVFTLIADKYWERSFILENESELIREGINNTLINNQYTINLLDIKNYIDQVGEELKFKPSNYLIDITPIQDGQVVYGKENIELDKEAKFTFDYSNSVINVNEKSQNEFMKETPIVSTHVIKQSFNLMGREYPLLTARYTCSTISLILLLFLIFSLAKELKLKQLLVSEINRIDKKYKGRIIDLQNELSTTNKVCVNLDCFKSLVKIADEREQPIFKKLDSENKASYYVVDGDYIYRCKVKAKNSELEKSNINIKSWGSDPTHAK